MLRLSELPRRGGTVVGLYRLRLGHKNERFFGVQYRNGVSVDAVKGRIVMRQATAYGPRLKIEPFDEATATLVAEKLERQGKAELAKEVRALFASDDTAQFREWLSTLKRDELLEVAAQAGVEIPPNANKAAIRQILETAEANGH